MVCFRLRKNLWIRISNQINLNNSISLMIRDLRFAVLFLICCWTPGWTTLACAQTKPNIIVINLDDADAELFEMSNSAVMFPNIMKLANDGITFKNFHVTTPLCGPSRASFYRGQYAHNTGIRVNRPGTLNGNGFSGGFRLYREQGYFENDLSTWMKDAGYRTMMVGKFLHADVQRYIPPGWDDFRYFLGGRYYGSFVLTNATSDRGEVVQLPESTYRTIAEKDEALQLMTEHVLDSPDQPFFLNINPLGPHRAQNSNPEMIEARMQNWWTRLSQPRSLSYDEQDVSDKGGFFSQLPSLSLVERADYDVHFRERALATRSVDDLVGEIRKRVNELGLADNTYIFVTSDNGFHLGHHRSYGKGVPYDRVSRVPCFVIGPNVDRGQVSNHLVGHIDLAPTLVSLGGSRAPSFIDGRSFERLLAPGGVQNTASHRLGLLIENWANIGVRGDDVQGASISVRFASEVYTEWADGSREYYDLSRDPMQLDNRINQLASSRQQLYANWLRVLYNTNQNSEAKFSTPFQNGAEYEIGEALKGTAEHWDGVERVRLAIWDNVNRRYWDGESWQDEFTQVEASLASPGGQLSHWSFSPMPNNSLSGSDRFTVWAWAFDSSNQFAPPNRISFRYDRTPPKIEVLELTDTEFDADEQVEIYGSTSDAVGARRVELLVQNRLNNTSWNGTSFQAAPVYLKVPTRSSGSWSWLQTLPSGSYRMTAFAFDGSENRSNSAVFSFRVR